LLHARLADYMMAARKVRLEAAPVDEVAKQTGLEAPTLKKWTAYLTPSFRPFLEKWRDADAQTETAAVRALAEEYQTGLSKTAQQWTDTLRKWDAGITEALRTGSAPPATPEFLAFTDRFFAEVSLAFGTYQEGIKDGPFALRQEDREMILSEDGKGRLA